MQQRCEVREVEARKAMEELEYMQEQEQELEWRIEDAVEKIGMEEGLDLGEIERRIRAIQLEEDERDMAQMF